MITFDLSQADNDGVFKEGSFLAGNATWIKRIFTNTEIDRINSFSDKALVTYGSSNSPTVKAANILELARDIRSYLTLGNQGVQVIAEGSEYSADDSAKTILRGVAKNNVDAEKPAALNEVTISGAYSSHLVSTDKNSVIVVTSKTVTLKEKYYSYQTWYQVHQVSLAKNGKLNVVSSEAWTPAEKNQPGVNFGVSNALMPSRYPSYEVPALFTLPSDEAVISAGSELKLISASESVETKSVAVNNCGLTKESQGDVKKFNNQLYLVRTTAVDLKGEFKASARASKNEILPLSWNGSNFSCGQAINVPGYVIAFDGQVMITSDNWAVDSYTVKGEKEEQSNDVITGQSGLTSLKVVPSEKGTHLVLVDGMTLKANEFGSYIALPKSFSDKVSVMKYTAKSSENYSYLPAKFETVTADKEAYLTQSEAIMPEAVEYGSLAQLLQDPAQPSVLYAVVKGWRQMQIVKFASASSRPQLIPVVPVDYKNQKQKLVLTVNILEGYSYSGDTIHFSDDQKSIEVSSGLFGLKQFFLQQ